MTVAYMLLLAFGIGVATAAQSPTNGSLGSVVGPIQASFVSFAGGLFILSVLCVFLGTGDITKFTTVPLWMLTGGLYAAYIVFVMAMCTHNLGVALSLTLIMLGQLFGGMAIDTFGLMESQVLEVSPLRLAGGCAVLAGIVLVYIPRLRDQRATDASQANGGTRNGATDAGTKKLAFQTVLVFSAGLASAFQAPTNAGLSMAVGTLESSVISFAGGFIALLIATLVAGKGRFKSFKGVKPWQLTGGLYGAYGVPALIMATPVLGVSLVMGGSMVGQLIAGMVIDAKGYFAVQKRRVDKLRLIGCAVLLAGVLLVTAGTY